ncbi:hypothetical protein HDC93_002878 [Streptomyces sp. AK010]|nr:hypothetical protein [Streptomyces sp. AK010]
MPGGASPSASARRFVEDHDHPAPRHPPAVWEFTDEWYDLRTNPRGSVRVPATADESSRATH